MTKIFMTVLVVYLSSCFSVMADNSFVDLVKGQVISDQDLLESIKQIEQHKDTDLKEALSVNPFHHRTTPATLMKQAFCQTCHLATPHQSNSRNRSFLNMHSRFVACETCHLQPEGVNFEYRWLAFGYPNAGQAIDVYSSVHTQAEKIKTTIVPRPGARIAPFYKSQPALIFKDHVFSQDVKSKWSDASIEDKARIKAELHQPLNKKGHSCDQCHSEQQTLLNLELLGAGKKQSHAITSNKIADFFSRYKNDDDRLKMSDLLR